MQVVCLQLSGLGKFELPHLYSIVDTLFLYLVFLFESDDVKHIQYDCLYD